MCNLKKKAFDTLGILSRSCKRCLWTAENKRQNHENYTFETTNLNNQ